MNLNIYADALDPFNPAKNGIQGRIFLALSTTGSIPGVALNGVFLLEINTLRDQRQDDRHVPETHTEDGHTFFDGFQTDAQGRPEDRPGEAQPSLGFRLVLSGYLSSAR